MIVTTADLYHIAYGKYAIGAYNVNNLEQILGMFRGLHRTKRVVERAHAKGVSVEAELGRLGGVEVQVDEGAPGN